MNHYAYLMDCAPITIGNHCFIGPSCGMYTANHPLVAGERNEGLEIALPITLEDNIWLGAGVTILPGVTIGKGSVIGAGSVVTKDIPPACGRRGQSLPGDPGDHGRRPDQTGEGIVILSCPTLYHQAVLSGSLGEESFRGIPCHSIWHLQPAFLRFIIEEAPFLIFHS